MSAFREITSGLPVVRPKCSWSAQCARPPDCVSWLVSHSFSADEVYTVAQQGVSYHEHKAFRFQGRIPLGI